MKKIKLKLKKRNFFILILLIVFLCCFSFSLYKIIEWKKDSDKTKKDETTINDQAQITEISDDGAEVIEQKKENKNNLYWSYINMPLIDVNLSDLKQSNSDTVGWVQVNGTNINYPVVQTKDNDYYLTHSFDKSYNIAGWVFMDYRNNKKTIDKNTIIYAHGMYNNTMFGSLRNIVKSSWYKNSNNYVIKFVTENQTSLWQVFSVYRIKTTSDYIEVEFSDDNAFVSLTEKLIKRSIYNFNTSVNKNDKIITLSTCYNKKEKVVMHAKLIKIKEK